MEPAINQQSDTMDNVFFCICYDNDYKTKRKPLSTSLGDLSKEMHTIIISERPKKLCLCFPTVDGLYSTHKWFDSKEAKEAICSR